MWLFNKKNKKKEFVETPKFVIVPRTKLKKTKKDEYTKSWILGSKEIEMSDIDMCIDDDD